MKLEPGNIWSGDRQLAVFTNPTELGFRKGNLKAHYPVLYCGKLYPDAEAAYQQHSRNFNHDLPSCKAIMVDILIEKFRQYPVIVGAVLESGGRSFFESCRHFTGAKNSRWEGVGRNSAFIDCLYKAFCIVEDETDGYVDLGDYPSETMDCHSCKKTVAAVITKKSFKTGTGFHLRADCPDCGKYIKFIKQ